MADISLYLDIIDVAIFKFFHKLCCNSDLNFLDKQSSTPAIFKVFNNLQKRLEQVV